MPMYSYGQVYILSHKIRQLGLGLGLGLGLDVTEELLYKHNNTSIDIIILKAMNYKF